MGLEFPIRTISVEIDYACHTSTGVRRKCCEDALVLGPKQSPLEGRFLRRKDAPRNDIHILRLKNIYKSPITHIIDLVDKKQQQKFRVKGIVIL